MINDKRSEELVAEMMFHETKNNHRIMDWDLCRDATPTLVNAESAVNLTSDNGGLVDVALNPRSSVKSMYFPPNPPDSLLLAPDDKLKMPQRVSTDVEALLKIDCELGPLRYQFSEIIGKARALGLSVSRFDFDISCRLNRPDASDRSVLSPTGHFLNQTLPPRVATSCNIENRSSFVDKTTSPSSTFSVVGKPTPRGSCVSCLNEDSSNCRQEALTFGICDHPIRRAFKDFNGLRSSVRLGNSASYFPTTDIHASQGENVPGERSRNEYVPDNDFQLQKSNVSIEREIPFRITEREIRSRSIGGISGSPSNTLRETEYNSHHRHFDRTIENSRSSGNNFSEMQKQKSSIFRESCFDGLHDWSASRTTCHSNRSASKSTLTKIMDNNWRGTNGGTNEKSSKHSEVPPGDLYSMAVQTEFISRGNDNDREGAESERVKNDRICSEFGLKSIDRGVGSDQQVSRVIFPSASQIRVVSVNTEFRATVGKRCTSRAVSPIRNLQMTSISSPKNMLLAARMSSVFVQQVRAASSREMRKVDSPPEIRSVNVDKKDDIASATGRRDFCARKVDTRPSESDEADEADLAMAEHGKTRYSLPETKGRIAIVKRRSSKTTNVNLTTPKYVDKMSSEMSRRHVPFEMRKSRRIPLSSNRNNELFHKYADAACLTEEINEKDWRRASGTSASRSSSREDRILPTTGAARNSKQLPRAGTKMREYREFARQRVARAIPGMRSSPEDFFCDT